MTSKLDTFKASVMKELEHQIRHQLTTKTAKELALLYCVPEDTICTISEKLGYAVSLEGALRILETMGFNVVVESTRRTENPHDFFYKKEITLKVHG